MMHDIDMFARQGPLDLEGFEGSDADWLDVLKKFIDDGKTVVTSPHKVYGPESTDLALQLRKRGIGKVMLAGMSANLCVEAHMRQTMGPKVPTRSDSRDRPLVLLLRQSWIRATSLCN